MPTSLSVSFKLTFLLHLPSTVRALANEHETYVGVEGDLSYGNVSSQEAAKLFKGEIALSDENDIHFPLLSVSQTLDTALSARKPANLDTAPTRAAFVTDMTERLLRAFGMPHTANTFVGNEIIRGVSGGERRRVSLAEMFSLDGAAYCWDNAIRGLDSAVALHFLRTLKMISEKTGCSNTVSIYQCSQEAYDMAFDRVIVINEGQMVFSGKTTEAQEFFEGMGYYKDPRTTTPDFLTGCTSPTERVIKKGWTGAPVPQTAQEQAAYFRNSPYYARLLSEIEGSKQKAATEGKADADRFRQTAHGAKGRGVSKSSQFRVNLLEQTWEAIKRQVRITRAKSIDLIVQIVSNSLNATLVGAIFFKPDNNATGSFERAGAIFFAILYFEIFSLGEVPATVFSRTILTKQRRLGILTPPAQTLAQMAVDLPLFVMQTLIFSSIFYFLIGLEAGAKQFFTFWFIILTSYLSISAMFRMIASWSPGLSPAIRYASAALTVTIALSGFVLPTPQEHGWISWLRRASITSYGLEALLANDFRTRTLRCADNELVPNGPGYADMAYQGCTIPGAPPGSREVSGSEYLNLRYDYKPSHIWRNVGILWAFYIIYAVLVIIGGLLTIRENSKGGGKLFISDAKVPVANEEKMDPQEDGEAAHKLAEAEPKEYKKVTEQQQPGLMKDSQVFTFEDVTYSVQVNGQPKQLLDHVNGYVAPGKLTALMGASGAGKTTLLDVVAGRKTTGVIGGDILVDGKPADGNFSRSAGFVMQGDIHDPFSTVRECIELSALLRQEAHVSREEKLAFAQTVIDLLELQPIEDAIIGSPEVGGLGVEERKRVTIGVELAAKPDFLLFLDEPTSGLDSQASFDIVRALQRIASEGIAVLCTIHQPSSQLFQLFDNVLLLARGGRQIYFGPTGPGARTVIDYFANHGFVMDEHANPAEFILETVSPVGGTTDGPDFGELWRSSPQAAAILDDIQNFKEKRLAVTSGEQGRREIKSYASSWMSQYLLLCERNWKSNWRDGSYLTTRLFICIFNGIFCGFFFYKTKNDSQGPQSLSLAILMLANAAPPIALDISVNFFRKFELWQARERNGVYSWNALLASFATVELLPTVVGYILLFFCSYWTVGFPTGSQPTGYAFLVWMTYGIFTATFGCLLAAVSPSPGASPYVLALFWNVCASLSGTLVPWKAMPQPFHGAFFWLSPLRWFYGGLNAELVTQQTITCTQEQLTRFQPPPGSTCAAYAADFLRTATGYLDNPSATADCGYCQYSTGADYVSNLGYEYGDRWRDWGVGLCFCVSNIAFFYALVWFFKVRPLYK